MRRTAFVLATLCGAGLVLGSQGLTASGNSSPGNPRISRAPMHTQTITLQNGWNAIYLEVKPDDPSLDAVFAGIPVLSVHAPNEKVSTAEFILDPAENLKDRTGYSWWFPTAPEDKLSGLFSVSANRAYLVHIDLPDGTPTMDLIVSGEPRLEPIRWNTDGYTLTGLPVDPLAPPTFDEFFAASPAHIDTEIYRLVAGDWQLISGSDTIQPGEAYSIQTFGASRYTGPLEIDLNANFGVDFGRSVGTQRVVLRSQASTQVSVEHLPGSPAVPLVYEDFSGGDGVWTDLPGTLNFSLAAAGDSALFRLGVRRQDMSNDEAFSVLSITDGAGTRRLVPVTVFAVDKPLDGGTRANQGGAAHPGLWVGTVEMERVSQPQTGLDTPVPVGKPLSFRVLFHVDSADQASLLRQVTQMWRPAVMETNGDGNLVVLEPGEFVLLTDPELLNDFSGVAIQDSTAVGVRMSTVGYDFDGFHLPMTGSVGLGNTVTVVLSVDQDLPTNPFKHRYHPDHDNLAADYSTPVEEAYSFTRTMSFNFDMPDPNTPYPPEWGDSYLEGSYEEVLSGLHRNDVYVEGSFRVWRRSIVDELNPAP